MAARGGTNGAVSFKFTGHDGANGSGDGNHGTNGSPVRSHALTFGSVVEGGSGLVSATGASNPGIGIIHAGGKGGSGSYGSFYAGGTGGGSASDATVWVMAPWTVTTSGSGAPGINIDHSGGHGGNASSAAVGDGGMAVVGDGQDQPTVIRTLEAAVQRPIRHPAARWRRQGRLGRRDRGDRSRRRRRPVRYPDRGKSSHGLELVSSGGVGGNAGHGVVFVGGGEGGSSGAAGDITVRLAGSVVTKGELSYDIRAHSIAGHGGDAGNWQPWFRTEGGSAGMVQIDSAAAIRTEGDGGSGLSALRTGGGDGHGGSSFALFFSQGGSGGNGGLGGKVDIDNSGTITTLGHNAAGISAQSIGGVGGNGGATGRA